MSAVLWTNKKTWTSDWNSSASCSMLQQKQLPGTQETEYRKNIARTIELIPPLRRTKIDIQYQCFNYLKPTMKSLAITNTVTYYQPARTSWFQHQRICLQQEPLLMHDLRLKPFTNMSYWIFIATWRIYPQSQSSCVDVKHISKQNDHVLTNVLKHTIKMHLSYNL